MVWLLDEDHDTAFFGAGESAGSDILVDLVQLVAEVVVVAEDAVRLLWNHIKSVRLQNLDTVGKTVDVLSCGACVMLVVDDSVEDQRFLWVLYEVHQFGFANVFTNKGLFLEFSFQLV
jgi:hypothetical protein